MSYAAQRDAWDRTPQELIVIGVRECQNHYASLVEQLLQYTDQFDNAAWAKISVTVTPNNATAPDGTLTADTVTFDAADDLIAQTVTGTAVTSKAFTGSVWLRIPTGAQTVTVRVRNAGGAEIGSKQVSLTTSWQRVFVAKLFSATPVDDLVFEILRTAGDDVTALQVWRANLSRNPGDNLAEIAWPSVRRVAESVGTISVNCSRCQAADAGDGNRCFFTRPTCQDPDGYNLGNAYEPTPSLQGFREYRFCRQNAPLALPGEIVLPYLERYDAAAQEIVADKAITMTERSTFHFFDDAGPGVWCLRQQQRGSLVNTASGSGHFWRRWMAIHRNYGNAANYLIRKVGFVEPAVAETDYQQRGRFVLRSVTLDTDDSVEIECTDRLRLTRNDLPAKISQDNPLAASLTDTDTTISLVDAGEISAPAEDGSYFVVLELDHDVPAKAEKANVLSRDLVNNTVTVQRGRWGTSAQGHARLAKVREVAEFGTERADPAGIPLGKNPLDIFIELYRTGGLDALDIDTAQVASQRDAWIPSTVDPLTGAESGLLFRRTITDKQKIETLAQEIRELLMLLAWVNEDRRLTCRLFANALPTETVTVLTDDEHLIDGSVAVEDSDETRITRALIAWSLSADADGDVPEDYDLIQVNIALDEEEAAYYGDSRAKVLMSKWLRPEDLENPASLAAHIVGRYRHGARFFKYRLDLKDDVVTLGGLVEIRSEKIQAPDGSVDARLAIVTKKKRRDDDQIEIEALEAPLVRTWFWAPDGLPDYDSASASQKRYGFLADDQGNVGARKELGYHWW